MNKTIEALISIMNISLNATSADVAQMTDLIDGLDDDIETIKTLIIGTGGSGDDKPVDVTTEVLPTTVEEDRAAVEETSSTTTADGRKGAKHKSHKAEVPKVTEYVMGLGRKIYVAEDLINKVTNRYKSLDRNFVRRVIKQIGYAKMTEKLWRYDQVSNTVTIGKEDK